MRIGLISDTHIPGRARQIPAEVLAAFRGVDLILHAGDLVALSVLDQLSAIAPVEAVAGNNDGPEVVERWGWQRQLTLEGHHIGLVHGHEGRGRHTIDRALSHFPDFDCVVFGHSHSAVVEQRGRTLAVNPGSPTDRRRWSPGLSYGFLYVEPQSIRAELRFLDQG